MAARTMTVVVGTGRTGSTVLSRILSRHPDVLSLNELFASLGGIAALPSAALSGKKFWQILASPHPAFDEMIRRGAPLPEFLYPRRPGRFSAQTTGIPAISLMTLPHLSDDPDALFDALAGEVLAWPRRSIARHYEALFESLTARFGRQAVVERSGHSLKWVTALRRVFPYAKFVHMYRNGLDCALSMSRHGGYRTAALANEILELIQVANFSEITEEHIRRLPDDLALLCTDGFAHAFTLDRKVPVARFGELWSRMVTSGVRALAEVPESMRTTLRYEDLVHSPQEELTRLAEFIGIDAGRHWLDVSQALLDGSRIASSMRLAPDELTALRQACAPGMRILGESVARTA